MSYVGKVLFLALIACSQFARAQQDAAHPDATHPDDMDWMIQLLDGREGNFVFCPWGIERCLSVVAAGTPGFRFGNEETPLPDSVESTTTLGFANGTWKLSDQGRKLLSALKVRTEDHGPGVQLVDVCKLKAIWKLPFDKELTTNDEFKTAEGEVQASFMVEERDVRYFVDERISAVDLPLAEPGLSVIFVLSAQAETPVAEVLAHARESGCLGSDASRPGKSKSVVMKIPRFAFETPNIPLAGVIGAAMRNAEPNIRLLSGFFSEDSPYLPAVDGVQTARVELDEQGIVAEAETVLAFGSSPVPPPKFTADRPFYFFVVDAQGHRYFSGRVADPSSQK